MIATGEYPFGLKTVEFKPKNKGTNNSTKLKSSLKRLQRFERQLLTDSNKAKNAKLKKKKINEILREELVKYGKISEKSAESLEEFIAKSEGGLLGPEKVQNKKDIMPTAVGIKPKEKKEKKIINTKKRKISNITRTPDTKNRFERNSGIWEVDELETSTTSPSQTTTNWITEEANFEKPLTRHRKKMNNMPQLQNEDLEIKQDCTPKKKKVKHLKSTEKEIILNGTNVLSTPKSSLRKKNLSTPLSFVKNPFSTPMSSAKKVKIALDLNRSQDHLEYHQSLVSSPGIPYDADRKPSKPLLKPRPSLSNAVNPFYKL